MTDSARPTVIKRTTVFALVVMVACVAAASAWADASPPSWRGTPGTTFQEWTFSTGANPAVPETVSNPHSIPSAAIDYNPPLGSGWCDTLPVVYGPAQGWWSIARGSIALSIVYRPTFTVNSVKDFQVQVVYWRDISQAPGVVVSPSAALVSKTSTLIQSGPIMGAWYLDVWTFHVDPNPNSESIALVGNQSTGSQIDSVAVDTRYVAVPDTAAQARSLPDGTVCELTGAVVTRSFGAFFYLEDPTRAAGIRVNCAGGQAPPADGTVPRVTGIIRTIDGERVLDEAAIEPGGSGSVSPLAMSNVALKRGLSVQGLLVRLWGKASVLSPGDSNFSIDDGAGKPVRVELYGAVAPDDESHVVVTGVVGADLGGPVLRAAQSDPVIQLD